MPSMVLALPLAVISHLPLQVIIILKQAYTVYICALAPSQQSKFLFSSLPCKYVSN